MIKNDWIKKIYDESFMYDFGVHYINRFYWLLWIYDKTKWNWIGKLLCNLENFEFHRESKRRKKFSEIYQTILEQHFDEIVALLKKSPLPSTVSLEAVNDTSGFEQFNAESVPWFGENYISINSGICYYSHLFVRCMQPYFIDIQFVQKAGAGKYLSWYWKQRFVKTSVAYISKNSQYAITPMFLIPKDDSLLAGIEKFVLSHEYAHLMIRKFGNKIFNFSSYFNQETTSKILADEEVAADAIALLILYYMVKLEKGSIYLLYGPQFIFAILSCYEKADLIPRPNNHPSFLSRYEYLKSMVNQLKPNGLYEKFDEVVWGFWNENREKIKNRSITKKNFLRKYNDICKELYHRYNF